jgi:protein gp37
MPDTKIRWATKSWNPTSGCRRISPGCNNCYAFTLAENRRGTAAFPVGFDPVMKPHKLREPSSWKTPEYIFVNSMSDLFLGDWTTEFLDAVHDQMLAVDRHVYIILTKRPKRMRDYYLGTSGRYVGLGLRDVLPVVGLREDGYLARRGLTELPAHIWPGVTIENDAFVWRADVLRSIPVSEHSARTISAEPLLSALPSLDMTGLGWIIAGGETGKEWRERSMADEWALDLRDRARAAHVPFFFKQHSAFRSEQGIELAGERIEERPLWEPHEQAPLPLIGALL